MGFDTQDTLSFESCLSSMACDIEGMKQKKKVSCQARSASTFGCDNRRIEKAFIFW